MNDGPDDRSNLDGQNREKATRERIDGDESRNDGNEAKNDGPFEFPTGNVSRGSDAPLAALAEELRQRRERDRPIGEPFEEVDVGDVDTDVLWERVLSDDEPSVDSSDRDVRTVPKRAYCERCQYLSSPPAVSCTHEGTEILELVDTDRFTVVDCPIVRENERLGSSVE